MPSPSSAPFWSIDKGYTRVLIKDLVTEARVGIHPWERHPEKPQRLIVNIEMFALQEGPHQGSTVETVLDYDHVRTALQSWPSRPHVPLIENLLEELVQLCFKDVRVAACRVSILKPDIFNEAGGAGVEVYRVRKT